MKTAAHPSHRRLNLHYMAMQCGFWAMFAGICAYQAALLLGRGFSSGQVGLIMAVRCLAGIICQPLLGGFADRHPAFPLKHIVCLSLGISFVAGVWFLLSPGLGLWGTLAVFFVVGGLELSAYPLMDAMAIQYISAGVPIRYSLGRGMGSLAYALVCILLGLQVGRWGLESVLLTHAVLVVAEVFLVVSYPAFHAPPPPPEGTVRPRPQSIPALLRSSPIFTLTLVGVLFGMIAMLPLSNFLFSVIRSRGGADASLGIALFLMGGFELPTAFFFQRLLRRLGSSRLLVVAMFFGVLKGVLLLLSTSLTGILLAQPLQMLGYGLFTPTSVFFVNELVPPADRVRGQTLMMVFSNGLGGVAGNLLGGRILDLGGPNLMLVCCIACGCVGVGLVSLAAWLRLRSDKN